MSSNHLIVRILQHYLVKDQKRNYALTIENNASIAVKLSLKNDYDLIFIGAECDGGGTNVFLEKIHLQDKETEVLYCPIIYLHSGNDFQQSLEALHQGAQISLQVEELSSEILHLNIAKILQVHELYKQNYQMTQELQRSNEELNHFSYAVSHDLRAPMRKIKSFAEILSDYWEDKLPQNEKEYLQRIEDSAQKSMDMMQGLLSYAQVSMQNKIHRWINLEEVINQVLVNLSLPIEESSAQVLLKDLAVDVFGDDIKLQQLFQNLLENSLKYAPKDKKPEIVIELSYPNNDCVQISVADNGMGFSASEGEYIIDLFQRLPSGIERSAGQGVGLAICKRIVENMDGKILVESMPGKGTTFYIQFYHFQKKDNP